VLGQAHPENVDRRAYIQYLQACFFAHDRVTAIRRDDQIRVDLKCTLRCIGANAYHAALLFNQVDDFGFLLQMKRGVALAVLGQEVKKIPLRHQSDEFALRGQMRKVPYRSFVAAYRSFQLGDFLMGTKKKIIKEAQFVHDFERRWMNRVASKIPQEVSVLFENDDVDTGASEKKSEDHSGRPTANDTAPNVRRFDSMGMRHRVVVRFPNWEYIGPVGRVA